MRSIEVMNVDAMQMFKESVLLKCLWCGYNDSLYLSKDISQSIYMDLTSYAKGWYGVGESLDSLAAAYAGNIKPSQINDHDHKKPIFFDCMQFYNSDEIEEEIKKILRKAAIKRVRQK